LNKEGHHAGLGRTEFLLLLRLRDNAVTTSTGYAGDVLDLEDAFHKRKQLPIRAGTWDTTGVTSLVTSFAE
jgi:hypothetical protein